MEQRDSLPGFRLDTKVNFNYGVFGTLTYNSLHWNWEVSGLAECFFTFTFVFFFFFSQGDCFTSPDQPIILTCILNFNMLNGSMQYIG